MELTILSLLVHITIFHLRLMNNKEDSLLLFKIFRN